ncbi:MAG TPA: S9 family peptidase [Salinivirgaceae bacterium]|mgnify:FL=1|nr:S9 family peptidase [Salinivirgaceae bacterium]
MRNLTITMLLAIMGIIACQPQQKKATESDFEFNIQLTETEIANGALTPEILWKFGRVGSVQLSPDGVNVLYTITYYQLETNKSRTSLFIIPVNGGEAQKAVTLSGSQFDPQWIDDKTFAFISTHEGSTQVYKSTINTNSVEKITDIKGGVNAFKISPDKQQILYTAEVKVGEELSDVQPDLPLANARIYTDLMSRHWDHWNDVYYSHIFVAPLSSAIVTEGKDIMPNEAWDSPMSPYFDAGDISWTADSKGIAYACKKFTGAKFATSTNSDIYLYNITTQETKNLTEKNLGYDKYPSFSPDGKYMAWQSMETPGYEADKERLMLLNLETSETTYLTANFDQNVSDMVWDSDSKTLFFVSPTIGTHQIYSINIESCNIEKYTEGHHDYQSVIVSGNTLVCKKMTHAMATEIFSVNSESKEEAQITFTNKPIYDHIAMGKTEERWVTTTDGKKMLVWVIYPPKFDSSKKYPALLYCQGGPQSTVSQFFSFRWNLQIMAANDYIIVAPNRRGVPSFGQEWTSQISGDYSGQNIQDYLTAIDEIKKDECIDENRLGCVGASYGGYSVFYLAGRHQKRFKAFISHCGMFNFESFYGATEETFFPNHDLGGAYWAKDNKVAQRSYANSPHRFASNWDTPILIIHGEYDFRIPYTESLQAFTAARLNNVEARLLIFPEETHFVVKPQNAVLWQREFFAWFDKYLK